MNPISPAVLRRQTLAELRQTVAAMMSPAWDEALQGSSREEITKAARTLLGLQRARLRLANAELAEIRDSLTANEAELVKGTTSLGRAVRDLESVGAVLEAATALLKTIGRIVEIVV